MVLIAISCDPSDITLLLEVSTFDQLKAEVHASFGDFVSGGMELDLFYHYQMVPSPSKSSGSGKKKEEVEDVEISVRCQQGLEAFLKETDQTPPMLMVRECEPLRLPSSLTGRGALVEEEDEAAPAPEGGVPKAEARKSVPSRSAGGGGGRKAGRPVSAATAGRVAAAPEDDEAGGYYGGGQEPAQMYATNQERAKALLASFQTPANPEPEKIRVVFRDGSASKLIPFNPFNPPMQYQLLTKVKTALTPLLDRSSTASAAGAGGQELVWMMAAYCPAVSSEYDLEDDRDVMHLGKLVKEYGDMEVLILVDVTDSGLEHINSCPERRARMREATSVLLTTEAPSHNLCPSPVRDDKLQVNLVHTPGRVKDRKKELADEEKRESLFSRALSGGQSQLQIQDREEIEVDDDEDDEGEVVAADDDEEELAPKKNLRQANVD